MTTPKTLSMPHRGRLVAATLALAVAGALAFSAAHAGPHGGHGGYGGHGGMGMAGMGSPMGLAGGKHLDRMLDAVDASAEQRSQIQAINAAARTDLQSQHDSGRALQAQAMQLFTQPAVDAREAEALRQQMLARHDEASKRMMQAMLDISRVLSPEQRQKLGTLMAERQEKMQSRQSQHRAHMAHGQ